MDSAIVLFAHGARDPEWAQPFHKIRGYLEHELPGTSVVVAFLEYMQPTLESAVAELATHGVHRITLIPMFFARGGHLKKDLPELLATIQQRHPEMSFDISPAIGEVDTVLRSMADWVRAEHRSDSRKK